jgi:PAS domain S-box-containing protein
MSIPLRILIVEDSEDDTQLLLRALTQGGFAPFHERVETAEAMARALHEKEWDAIIADYVLPNFSAPEAMRVIREGGRDFPFIIVSGKIGEDVAVEAMKAGAHDYLLKGNLARLAAVVRREIEEARVRAERRKVEQNYKALFEQMLSAIAVHEIILDDDGKPCDFRFLDANPMFEEMTGLRRADIIGRRVREVLPNIEPYWIERYGHAAMTGQPVQFEDYSADLDRYYEVRAFQTEPGKFAVVFNNTTARHRAEEALRQSEKRYRSMFENMINGFVLYETVKDARGDVIDVRYIEINPAFERILGLKRKDVIGKTLLEVFPKVDPKNIREYSEVAAGGASITVERYRYDTGQYFDTFLYCPQPGHVAAIFQDITDRRRAEIRQKARLDLLSGLNRAKTIDECLPLVCNAAVNAQLFRRALFLMSSPEGHIPYFCFCGFDKSLEKRLRGGRGPDVNNLKSIMRPKMQIDDAILIAAEDALAVAERFQIVPAAAGQQAGGRWENGDVLLVPIKIVKGEIEGWFWLDSPYNPENPVIESVTYIEDITTTVTLRIHQIRLIQELAAEQKALEEKNIALREILATIEVEKRNIRRQVAEIVDEVILPAATKMLRSNNTVNMAYYNLLLNNLRELSETSGSALYSYSKLSPREQEICTLIRNGSTSKEIAEALGIAPVTVLKHREIIRKKLGLTNRSINLVTHLRGLQNPD